MLHDLIFALQGYPGSIFKETSSGEVKVVPGLPFLSPSEETWLNRLLKLSTRIILFKKFIGSHNSTLYGEGGERHKDGLLHGCYLQALCYGLDSVLEAYYQTVLDIEKEILADPLLTVMHVLQRLERYHLLFDALHDLISVIKARKCHGCQILSTVHRASQSGNKLVLNAMLKIQQRLHLVMYRQLSTWLLHGLLIDRHQEFYIAKREENCGDDSVLSLQGAGLSSSTLDSQIDMFYIRAEMLPTYIPSRDAEIILFIGSSLHLFEKDIHRQDTLMMRSESPQDSLQPISTQLKGRHMEGILKEKEQEFMSDFLWLQNQERFCLEDFEMRLDKIRVTVARELWDLCVVKAKLVSNLSMLKDFYLLGLGELYLVFFEEAGNVMRKPVSKTTENDVNQAFLRSALKVQLEEDGALENFRLVIANRSSSKDDEKTASYAYDASGIMDSNDTWSLLGMTFKVKWPLHIIFTPSILVKYNKLFKFLLRVRRTQLALQNLWALQMQVKCSLMERDDDDLRRNVSNLTLRMHMSHLVDSLQYYLQADVLETHFSNLLSKVRDPVSTDFEQIILAHDNYLTALLAQCFILSTPVFRSLLGVLDICQQFCEVVTASIQSGTVAAREVIEDRVEHLAKDFERQSSLLFHTLSAVCNQQCNPHLAQFLLLLDYNKYYTRHL